MFTPILELEGTRDEIVAQLPDYDGQTLHVTVHTKPAEASKSTLLKDRDDIRLSQEEAERHLAILREVSEATSKIQSKPDNRDWLREGRAGVSSSITILRRAEKRNLWVIPDESRH